MVRILASLVAQMVKNLPAMKETWVQALGWEDPPEKRMATHSSMVAWRIPRTEEPGGLQSMGSQSWTRLSDQHLHFLQWSGFSPRPSPHNTHSLGTPLRPVPSLTTSSVTSQISVLLYFLFDALQITKTHGIQSRAEELP